MSFLRSFWKRSSTFLPLAMHGVRANMCSSASASALLQQGGLPRFEVFDASRVEDDMNVVINTFKQQFDNAEVEWAAMDDSSATFEAVVEAEERIGFGLEFAWGLVNHMMSVKSSRELRDAHEKVQPKVLEQIQRSSQSKPLYDALKKISIDGLNLTQQRIVQKHIEQMEKGGIALGEEDRKRFNALKLEIVSLSSKFSNNVLDATKKFTLVIENKKEVSGIPPSHLEMMAAAARKDGHEKATANHGPWKIGLDAPSVMAVLQFAENRNLRSRIHREYLTRASSGDENNWPPLKRILEIRREVSRLLGFNSFRELSLSEKMAETPEEVWKMIRQLKDSSFDVGKREIGELREFAKSEGQGDFKAWDVAIFSEKLKQKRFGFSQEELKPFFPLESTLEGLFSLCEKLFDVQFQRVDGVELWDPHVRVFNVKREGQVVATFFLDPFVRPSEKRGGAWVQPAIGKSRALGRKPVAYVVCNGSPPTDSQPSLLTFQDVETLFHEFGHNLQHVLTTVKYGPAAGISLVEWDAVELPSQFMENFVYDFGTVSKFAKHYKTGQPISRDLFGKVKRSRTFHAGLHMLRQLSFAALDMELHSAEVINPHETQRRILNEFSADPGLLVDYDNFLCSFQHIFAGGYAAGYYSYKYAEILSADAFAAFEEVGLDNEKEVAATGRRFRDTVLALGGGTHPREVFRSFRGRDPTPEALLRHSGLGQQQNSKL